MCSYRPWEQLYRFRIFFIFSLVLNDVRGDTCPSSCSCEEKDIRCNGLIPDYLPSYAENVILYHIDADNFVARKFCNVSWSHNIKQLSFITVKAVGPFNMVDDVFDCLTGLERLQLSDGKIHNFTSGTFNSLLNLSTLDLSGCTEIYTKDISIALSTASSLPKLSSLILVQTGRHGNLEVTQDLIDSLGRRNIKVIDLSQTVILFRASNIDPVCDTLAVFNLSYTQFDSQSRWAMARTCDSLRILDISGMVYPKTYIGPKHIKRINRTYIFDSFLVFLILPTSLFRSLTAFYINNMLGPDHHIEFINCSFSVEFNNSLKEIHMSRSGLNRLEVEVTMVHNHISYVDLSFNDIEEISSNFFSNMSNLTKVDLSFNKLYNIMYFDKTFSEIFTHNKHLVEVDLSRNNLKYLPAETFSTNFALEQLDLSGNSLQQISFEIKQLLNLNKLNLARNSITYLDTNSRKRLDSLYQGRCQRGCRRYRSNKFVVDLQGNPFSCACQSLEFIQWFVSSPIFNETRLLYSCEFDGQKFPLDRNALITAEGDCSRPRRKMRNILLSVFIPLASVAIIAAFIYILLRRRRLLHTKKHYDENVALIRDNPSDQFPVFLSYSSDDRDLVVNHLFKPLEVCKMSVSNTPAVNDNLEIYFEAPRHMSVIATVAVVSCYCSFLIYSSYDAPRRPCFIQYLRNMVFPRHRKKEHHLQALVDTNRELVCIGDTHFRPGHSIFDEISSCLENCAVVVAAMSDNYCRSEYCKLEIEQARLKSKSIILIFLEDVNEGLMNNTLKEVFKKITRVRLVLEDGKYKLQPGWDRVCESIIQMM